MKKIVVSLKERSYPIMLGSAAASLKSFLPTTHGISGRKIFLISTRALNEAGHVRSLQKTLIQAGYQVQASILPNGEKVKNWETVGRLLRQAAQYGLDRKSMILGLGGGVVTDLAGFVASIYMRGISYLSIPTTLLGMVDAAIGGKTGIDLPEGKNLAGSFWQPKLVGIDAAYLKTLPRREWQTGFAEVIKYGVIFDAAFFSWLEKNVHNNSHVQAWTSTQILLILKRSAQIKAHVVSGDERETPLGGGREILNFGHTVGHALEAVYSYKGITHGQAISIGMNVAGNMALSLKMWSHQDHTRMVHLLSQVGLPTDFPLLTQSQMVQFWKTLSKDKKNVNDQWRFVLPTRIGQVHLVNGISKSLVEQAIIQSKVESK